MRSGALSYKDEWGKAYGNSPSGLTASKAGPRIFLQPADSAAIAADSQRRSIGLGGIASILPGMVIAKVTLGKRLAVTATGAAAVYVVTYFYLSA